MLPSSNDEPFLSGHLPSGYNTTAQSSALHPNFMRPDTPDGLSRMLSRHHNEGNMDPTHSPPALHSTTSLSAGFGSTLSAQPSWPANFVRSLSEDHRGQLFPGDSPQGPGGSRSIGADPLIGGIAGQGQNKPTNIEVTNELSIFVGDLSSTLQEEDLVNQFLDPPAWPSGHPCLMAYVQSHAHMIPHDANVQSNVGPAPFTGIKGAKIMTDPVTNASRGFGFVRFYNTQEAQRALIEMNGVVITPADGRSPARPLRVCPATAKSKSQSGPGSQSVGSNSGISSGHGPGKFLPGSQQSLRSSPPSLPGFLRDQPGESLLERSATRAPVIIDKTSQQAANQAANAASASDPRITTVFVGGLSSLVSEATLRTFFAPFGEISYVKIPPGKGCGFVAFLRKSEAQNAIDKLQGFRLAGSSIRLSWGRSQGDKAAAAAAAAAASDYPSGASAQDHQQVSQLANNFGLTGLSVTQINQLQELIQYVYTQAVHGRNVFDPSFQASPQAGADASSLAYDASGPYARSSSDGSLAMLPSISQPGVAKGGPLNSLTSSSLLMGRPQAPSFSLSPHNAASRWPDYDAWGNAPESSLFGGLPRAQSPLFSLSETNHSSQL